MPPMRDANGRFLPKGSQPPTPSPSGSGNGVQDIDKGWNDWASWMRAHRNGASVEIGIFVESVAVYALANEFGTANIPERSFIRSTFDRETPQLMRMIDAGILNAQTKLVPLSDALIPAANHLRNEIIKTIQSGVDPANAPSTADRKGFNAPLVETGQMQRALTWRVVT